MTASRTSVTNDPEMATDRWPPTDGDGATVIEYTPDDGTPTSIAIVRTIAAIKNVDPTALEFTLYDYVNPEALDLLVEHEGAGGMELRFAVDEYDIHVFETGEIIVRESA